MTSSPALALAAWIYPRTRKPITHLKLQKLTFYVYGAALAFDLDATVGHVPFEAWKHGPVSRDLWKQLRDYKDNNIPSTAFAAPPTFTAAAEQPLLDALVVYDALETWALRQESHREQPWLDARQHGWREIDADELREFFRKKFNSGRVAWPEHLLRGSSFSLDGIPLTGFPTLHALASAVRAIP